MRKGKTYILVIALLVAVIALAGVLAACGGDDTSGRARPPAQRHQSRRRSKARRWSGPRPSSAKSRPGWPWTSSPRARSWWPTTANYAPQSYLDPDTNEIIGFDVDVAKGMAEILGLGIKWEHPAWETIPGGLNNGRYDVSIGSMTITPERQETLDFSDPYYYTSGQVFVKKGGTQIAGVEDLAGKTVGVGAQTTYYDFLKAKSDAVVKTYTTDVDAFPDLLNGNLDFVMTAGPTGQQAILEGKAMEFSGKPLYYEDLAMAVKKGETDWVALLTYAVQQMHENGALTEMSKQWYNGIDLTVKE